MSETQVTGRKLENMGASGRKAGPRADSDLSGSATTVGGEKGLETAPRASIVWARLGDFAKRMVGDPVGLIEREELLDPIVNVLPYDVLVVTGVQGLAPDVIECLGHRYVHEERVTEAREFSAKLSRDLEETCLEMDGLRDDVRAAEKAADEFKAKLATCDQCLNRAMADNGKLRAALIEANAKIAELSKVRIFNAVGLIEADLAERYESLRQSFDTLADQRASLNAQLREARALIAESAPVVRLVQDIANLEGDELEAVCSVELRDTARNQFATPADYDPRTYTDVERQRAAKETLGTFKFDNGAPIKFNAHGDRVANMIDAIAEKLGMRRAS